MFGFLPGSSKWPEMILQMEVTNNPKVTYKCKRAHFEEAGIQSFS